MKDIKIDLTITNKGEKTTFKNVTLASDENPFKEKDDDILMTKEELEIFDKNISHIKLVCYVGLLLSFVLWLFE